MPRRRWPWEEVPRASITMTGDIDGVIASGLMNDVGSVHRFTSLLCVGIPEGESCEAIWTVTPPRQIVLDVRSSAGRYAQTFIRQTEGWVVIQNLMVLIERYRGGGHAKRLVRNLAIVYDELGIIYASTVANDVLGGYVWAALGARARDPALQRRAMLEKLEVLALQGQIPREYAEAFISQLSKVDDDDLMQWISQLYIEDGADVGRLLLAGHAWEAYWDLNDNKVRDYIRDALQ